MANRECGDCSMCCKLLKIDALDKPANKWCEYANPGHGCKIHTLKPDTCKTFECSWSAGLIPERLKPNKIKAIVYGQASQNRVIVCEDPSNPGAYDRTPELQHMMQELVNRGVEVVVMSGHNIRKFTRKPRSAK